jgi:hypothetical protein
MKNTVRTIYGAYLQNCMFYGEQPVIMPNSTLNQKFDVAKDQLLKKGEFPVGQYIAIGLNGATREPNANGRLVTKYREYIPSWGSLLEYFPFIMRPRKVKKHAIYSPVPFSVPKIRFCPSAVNDSAPIHQSYKKTISFLYKKPPRLPLRKPGRFILFIGVLSDTQCLPTGIQFLKF